MATTEEILQSAGTLGRLLSTHPAMTNYRDLVRQVELDVQARNLLGEFEQLFETIGYKEASMQPIEVAEKQKFQSLQQSVAMHPVLKKLMAAQVEYADLMNKVQEAINQSVTAGGDSNAAPAPAPSKIII